MLLARSVQQQIEVEGVQCTVRALTYRELEEARDARVRAAIELARAVGLDPAALPRDGTEAAEPADETAAYDTSVVLRYGLVAWSLADPPAPDELTQAAAQRLKEAILELSLRPRDEVKAFAGASPPPTDRGEGAGQLS